MRFIILIIITFILTHPLFPQEEVIKFDRFQTKEGLTNEYINAIFKDSKGFMWFGTNSGVFRYDGYEFRKYSTSVQRPTGLINNTFYCILEDKKGNLWFGTQGGIAIYSWERDRFSFISHDNNNPNSLSDNNVRSIVQDDEDIFWIATYGGGLNKYIPKLNKFYRYRHNNSPYSLPSDRVNTLYIDSHKNLWIGTELGGLVCFDKKKEIFLPFNKSLGITENIDAPIIATIKEDSKNNLWVGAWEKGMYCYNFKTHKLKFYGSTSNSSKSLSYYTAKDIAEDKAGNIWIATYGGGLNKLNVNTGKFTYFKNNPFDKRSISYDGLWSLFVDETNVLWIGSYGSGLSVFDPNKHKFKHYQKLFTEKNTLSSNFISTLFCDSEGNLWIGTSSLGINFLHKKTGQYTYYLNEPNTGTGGIRSFFEDENKNIWVGTDEGVVVFDKNRNKTRYYHNIPGKSNSFSTNPVESINKDKFGNFWFATWSNGIFILPKSELSKHPDHANFINYTNHPNDPKSTNANTAWIIFKDSNDNIWIGNDGGLELFDNKNSNFIRYPIDGINSIIEDKNELFVGTFSKGVARFNLETRKFSQTKLSGITCCGLTKDKSGRLWVTSEDGLYLYDTNNDFLISYSEKDGLQSNKFNNSAIAKSPDGTIYIGGNNGYNSFNPDEIQIDNTQIKVVFTDVILNGKSISLENASEKDALLEKQLIFENDISIADKPNNLEIAFAGLKFSGSETIKYRYKLINFDTCWYYTTSLHRKANYTNLSPGKYTFAVEAANTDGIWPNQSNSLNIIILPQWYQTTGFKGIVILIILISFYLIYAYRLRRINILNARLTLLVDERTKELNEKNKILEQQTLSLSESNALLEERQMQIEEQTEELLSQKEELLALTDELSKKTIALEASNSEIQLQRDNLEEMYRELINYRNRLEELVEERTKAYLIEKEKAVQSEKLKSAFLANMSHEIRTPLNAIVGFANLMNEPGITEDEKKEFGKIIENNSNFLLHLINDILDISKIEAGLFTINKNQVKLIDLFNDIDFIFNENLKRINKASVTPEYHTTIAEEVKELEINTDPIRLKQILTNLITNAIKYTKEGFINFGCNLKDEKTLLFYVQDTGIGIKDENQELIFERFRKVEDPDSEMFRGTGIGLALVKELVGLLGGKIWVESEYGKGSTFYVTLPF